MRLILILSLALIASCSGNKVRKVKYHVASIELKVPADTRVYLSTEEPLLIADTFLLPNDRYVYLGKGRMSSSAWEGYHKGAPTSYAIYTRPEHSAMAIPLNELPKTSPQHHYVDIPEWTHLPQKDFNSLAINLGEVNVEIKDSDLKKYTKEAQERINPDRTSYFHQSEVSEESIGNSWASAIENYTNLILDRLGHHPEDMPMDSRMSTQGRLDIDVAITHLEKSQKYLCTWNIGLYSIRGDKLFENEIPTSTKDIWEGCNEALYMFLSDPDVENSLELAEHHNAALPKYDSLRMLNNSELNTSGPAHTKVVSVVTGGGHGSGCVISDNGHVLTNNHVIAGTSPGEIVDVITHKGDTLKGTVLRRNAVYDLALISIHTENDLPHFQIRMDKAPMKMGSEVFVIGSPLDVDLRGSVSKGVVAAYRDWDSHHVLQVSAVVNPGNSGGALVDENGELVGVVFAKRLGEGSQRIGLTVPAWYVEEALGIKFN